MKLLGLLSLCWVWSLDLQQTQVLAAAFNSCDIDGDLGLDQYELAECLEGLRGVPEDEDFARTIVDEFDADVNGRLEEEEWSALWNQTFLT
jgi:Ca2+-binding EF-hand superfamily protein